MKVYVVTSLIENAEVGAEINVIGIRKTKQEAYLLLIDQLKNVKQMYEDEDIDFDIQGSDEYIQISANEDTITLEYQESEVD